MRNIRHPRLRILGWIGVAGYHHYGCAMNATRRACLPALYPASASDRGTQRQRRLVEVKFMALPMPDEVAPASSRVSLLTRVCGFLAAARR